ncbi:GMC oxidoreductase [Xylariomycetidae sp. FL2044]|nr:GMC oxidoreductase [Xylariomycetidae sp. FL2044]
MGVYKSFHEDIEDVDVIVAGGGSAGCVVAGRLAEADPNLSVLIIEGGRNNHQDLTVTTPALYLNQLKPSSDATLFYQARKSPYLADRACIVPAGGILGGGSSINFMLYTRGQAVDFDSWKTPGWTADDLWPYLKKLETYHGPGEPKHHGFSGPVQVSDGTHRAKSVEDQWMRAAAELGFPEIRDLQDLESGNGFQRWLRTVTPEGKRSDAAHAYVHPLMQDGKHPKLHLLVESNVVRVLFDEHKRACGVEFTPNAKFIHEGLTPKTKHVIRARKMVVLSCGACGSPPVLERSGVGNADIIEKIGIPVLENLPGVGHDYQDHHLSLYRYKACLQPDETLDVLFSGRLALDEAIAQKSPLLGWNGCDIAGKLRPNDDDIAALGPEFQEAWDKDFKDQPTRPLMLLAVLNGYFGDHTEVPPGEYLTVAPYTAYPYSRGHIHITGPEVEDELDFDVGFFSDANDIDIKKQVWAYKKSRQLLRRTKMYRGEVALHHPVFPSGSKAACVEDSAGGGELEDLEYTEEDDKAIEKWIRENVNTTWHSLGTAKMAPREDMGVVDKDLNVYGVQGLKVADLSIVPENVGANTNNTALVIGEKCADIIMYELGIMA